MEDVRTGDDPQRGSVLATATVILAGLLAVAGFTVIVVQRSIGVTSQQRGHAQALHAAEAGVAAAASFLRASFATDGSKWTSFIAPPDGGGNPVGVSPVGIAGNGALPGTSGNPFGATAGTWYDVLLFNNPADPQYGGGLDQDGIVIIRSIGHGPDNARVVLEVEVQGTAQGAPVTRRSWRETL